MLIEETPDTAAQLIAPITITVVHSALESTVLV